ncbi:ribosome-assembly protein 3-domain-containing protein [Xylariales sp. PMI_506]|nr:ribosome-assembly protein 3-domain-containing protein [Xylariales sp. PMI_506]
MSRKDNTPANFTSFYLQQATQEFSEDLDKVRGADDFKGDALQMLIVALQQEKLGYVQEHNQP